MAVSRDHGVGRVDQDPQDRELGHEREWHQDWYEVRDPEPRSTAREPATGRFTSVHGLEQLSLGRHAGRRVGHGLKGYEPKSVSSVKAMQNPGCPGAEAAIGVVEDLEADPSRRRRREGRARRMECATHW
jgi:hypothetical protein